MSFVQNLPLIVLLYQTCSVFPSFARPISPCFWFFGLLLITMMMAARASQHHFMGMHGGFDHSLQMPPQAGMMPQGGCCSLSVFPFDIPHPFSPPFNPSFLLCPQTLWIPLRFESK
jgi:hypothetical protein